MGQLYLLQYICSRKAVSLHCNVVSCLSRVVIIIPAEKVHHNVELIVNYPNLVSRSKNALRFSSMPPYMPSFFGA
jgi:hypothetical protein